MLSNLILKSVVYAPVVLNGIYVKNEVEDIFIHIGVCSTLMKIGLADAKLVVDNELVLS